MRPALDDHDLWPSRVAAQPQRAAGRDHPTRTVARDQPCAARPPRPALRGPALRGPALRGPALRVAARTPGNEQRPRVHGAEAAALEPRPAPRRINGAARSRQLHSPHATPAVPYFRSR